MMHFSGENCEKVLYRLFCCGSGLCDFLMKIMLLSMIHQSLIAFQASALNSIPNLSPLFSESMQEIGVSTSLHQSHSLEVNIGSGKLVSFIPKPKYEVMNKSHVFEWTEEKNVFGGVLIDSKDFVKDCGRDDKCPSEDVELSQNSDGETVSFAVRSQRHLDYSDNPYFCRCDVDECLTYGDCCWNITIGVPLRTTKNLWKCNLIPEQNKYALMMSECPPQAPSYLTELCALDPWEVSSGNYTYLVDIPVLSKVTQILYRNIYCARCHGEKNAGILHWKTHLFCSDQMTSEKQDRFIQNAQYFPGQRYFQDKNNTCVIYISELINSIQKLEEIIPTIRYCGGNSIDTCPHGSGSSPDAFLSRDAQLCSSYTQHIQLRDSKKIPKIYKNYHCARCNGKLHFEAHNSGSGNNNSSIPRIQCFRRIGISTKIPSPAPPRGPQGISLLFDFALDTDEAFVGFENLCKDDEIWDYLHKRCQVAVCQKGYYLQGEACHPIVTVKDPKLQDSSEDTSDYFLHNKNSSNYSHNSSWNQNQDDSPINSTCMRILLFESEYNFISKNNSSIIVHDPKRMDKPIIFHPEDYEYWNETTLAVCAKDLHEGFINRFSSLLNYLSTISIGISVIFSFLHILIYLSLPKLQNLPGKTLFCLTVSLFISQLIFLCLITHSRWQEVCISASITMHYSFLASFFWMNVMSFDIWRTFSRTMLLSRTQTNERKNITFLKYSFFAWITPMFIVGLAVLVEFLPIPSNQDSKNSPGDSQFEEGSFYDLLEKIKPLYGKNGFCWFGQRLSLFVFFAFPVALVIFSNIILFSLSAKAILVQNKEAGKVFQNNESNKSSSKKISTVSRVSSKDISMSMGMEEIKVKLYAKLALIMGITWIMGFISNFPKMEWLWFPFVVLNGLQGTFIFFAFDCKMKIVKMLKERYGKCKWSLNFKGWMEDSKGIRRRKEEASHGDSSATMSRSFNRTSSTTVSSSK